MKQYEELERACLNCYYIKPELMEKKKLGARHFKKYHALYNVFEDMYNEVRTIDFTLLKSMCKDPGAVMNYVAEITDTTSITANYAKYEARLLKLYLEHDGVEEIHKWEKKLYNRSIDLATFKSEVDKICGGYYG